MSTPPVVPDPPSGEQHELVAGEQRATVVEVGAAVRAYRVGDLDVLDPFDAAAMPDGAHGAVLVPWPNRIGEGRYSFDGVEHQLPLTEPTKNNAIHGLLRWVQWRAVRDDEARVTLATRIHPQPGYPFDLHVQVSYVLDDGGLTVTTTAANLGGRACPYGSGQHPYLSAGGALLDACTATVPARTRITTDDERQLPTGREPVEGTAYDLRLGRSLEGLRLDDAFADLDRGADGRARASLTPPDGVTRELWVGGSYHYLQAFSGDTLAPDRRRRGLGMEPMTCPPDAFRSGTDVQRLEPGESTTAEWGVRLLG